MRKQRRVELKSVGNFVAKTVLVESANQFSLEELCRTQNSSKYFFSKPRDNQTYGKTVISQSPLAMKPERLNILELQKVIRDLFNVQMKIY